MPSTSPARQDPEPPVAGSKTLTSEQDAELSCLSRQRLKVNRRNNNSTLALLVMLSLAVCLMPSCKPVEYRREADKVAAEVIRQKQAEALGRTEAFTIEPASQTLRRKILLASGLPHSGPASLGSDKLKPVAHWPEEEYPRTNDDPNAFDPPWNADESLTLSLDEALQVAARNNRSYQSRKEDIFQVALDLDLERDDFRNTFSGALESFYSSDLGDDPTESGIESGGEVAISRQLQGGAFLTGRIAVDLVNLLTMDRASAFGILADATISIPLLRGSGAHIVSEPLTQAERNVIYEMFSFERYKRTLAVSVATGYLSVLQQLDRVKNAENNYRSLVLSGRRARRLADAGRLPEIQVDQTRQNELRARDQWISARQSYAGRLDSFKTTLGLPTDANIELDRQALQRLAQSTEEALGAATPDNDENKSVVDHSGDNGQVVLVEPSSADAGPLEMEPSRAVELALANRLDLRTALGQVYDAQRDVVIAADNLGAELTLAGNASMGESRSIGSVDSPNAQLRPERGFYSAGLILDLPLERTAERNAYRNSYILLERAVRNVQELEDDIKLDVRNALRNLLQAREGIKIQAQAVQVATKRVASTKLFLEAGRAEIRDVLEAQEDLLDAQNDLTSSLVDYRITELELQRDMGLLEINEKGLWREYKPQADQPEQK